MPVLRRRRFLRAVTGQTSQPIRRPSAVSNLVPFCHGWRVLNYHRSFDLCQESGAYDAFFSDGRGALLGNYEEVSCSEWSGQDGPSLWNGACLAGEGAKLWPNTACGNAGMKFLIARAARSMMAHVLSRCGTRLLGQKYDLLVSKNEFGEYHWWISEKYERGPR